MIKNILSDIGGIGVYGIITLALFFGVFITMLIMTFGIKRTHAETMSRLPLDEEPLSTDKGDEHE